MADVLLCNALIPELDRGRRMDLLIRNGLIESVGAALPAGDAARFDCRGLWLLPGAIDMHVHFREPGATHKEDIASGSRAAAIGGVTTVADMPNNNPPVTTAAAFRAKAAIADGATMCDVKLYMALTDANLDEIISVAPHPRFAGVKVFLGATTGNMLCTIGSVEQAANALDCLFVFHAETDEVLRRVAAGFGPGRSAADHLAMRPVAAALDAVRRIAAIHRPGMRFHICHVTTPAELEIIKSRPGMTCEAAPHHLAFSAELTERAGDLAKMNPPLRDEDDRAGLYQSLVNGGIDCLATDHAPHTLAEKSLPWPAAPSGVPGVETLVPWTLRQVQVGLLDIADAVRLLSSGPAAILGLGDRGHVGPGMLADLMLWDPESEWVVSNADIASKCGWSLFDGIKLAGKPVHLWRAGTMIY